MAYSKIHPVSLGVAFAIISGVATFFTGLIGNMLFTGKPIITMMGEMYVTYNLSLFNCILAGFTVSINAFIAGYISAWIYNFMLRYAK
jgi:hypothetical protein